MMIQKNIKRDCLIIGVGLVLYIALSIESGNPHRVLRYSNSMEYPALLCASPHFNQASQAECN